MGFLKDVVKTVGYGVATALCAKATMGAISELFGGDTDIPVLSTEDAVTFEDVTDAVTEAVEDLPTVEVTEF